MYLFHFGFTTNHKSYVFKNRDVTSLAPKNTCSELPAPQINHGGFLSRHPHSSRLSEHQHAFHSTDIFWPWEYQVQKDAVPDLKEFSYRCGMNYYQFIVINATNGHTFYT